MHLLLSFSAMCVPRTLFTINYDALPYKSELFQEDSSSASILPYFPEETNKTAVYSLVIGQTYTLKYWCTSGAEESSVTLQPGTD